MTTASSSGCPTYGPYLTHRRQSHELGERRAELIVSFLRRAIQTEHVVVWLRGSSGPGPDYGSCSRFFVHFDESWRPVEEQSYALRKFSIVIAVSDRGPFVTGHGLAYEWEPHPIDVGRRWQVGRENSQAEAKAAALAADVAREFELTSLNAECLRQEAIDPRTLPWADVLESLDMDLEHPTALSVLFCEHFY